MLLLSMSPPAARHVIDAAFDRQARGNQLVSLLDSTTSYIALFILPVTCCL